MSKKQAKKQLKSAARAEQAEAAEDAARGDELANKALTDPAARVSIEEQLDELSTEEAELFVRALELALRKRRWMLIGYLGALVSVVIGTVIAIYIFGTREPGTFVGWVFLLPPAMAGACIWASGWYVKKIGTGKMRRGKIST